MKKSLLALLVITILISPSGSAAAQPGKQTLVIGVLNSLVPAEHWRRTKRTLEKLIDLTSQEMRVPLALELIDAGSREEFEAAARLLKTGRLDFLVGTGLEYAWLMREKDVDVDVVAVVSPSSALTYDRSVLVSLEKNLLSLDRPNKLTIAVYDRPSASTAIFGRHLLGKDYKKLQEKTAMQALRSVVRGDADATIVTQYTYGRFAKAFAGQGKKLQVVRESATVPISPIIGMRSRVERKHPGAWDRFEKTITAIHTKPKSVAFLEVWSVERFLKKPTNYDQLVLDAAKEFPLKEFP